MNTHQPSTKHITVFGSSQPAPGSAAYEQARLLGRLLAEAGYGVINGGYSGTMQGVSQGVAEAGGRVVGVTCAVFDGQRPGGNRFLTEAIHAPDLLARLRKLVELGDAYVVLHGGIGTLLELFLVWNLVALGSAHKPCILVGPSWRCVLEDLARETQIGPQHTAFLDVVDTVEQAVSLLRKTTA